MFQHRSNFCIYVILILYNAHVNIICGNIPQTIFSGLSLHPARNYGKSMWCEVWLYHGFEDYIKIFEVQQNWFLI